MNRFDRRRLLGSALLLGAGSLGVTACGRSDQRSGAGGQSTRLKLGWWGNNERDKRTRDAIKAYSKQNENVRISEQVVNWDSYWDKLNTQVAGGNAPDVIQMDYAYITQYASQGSLLKLDEYIPDVLAIKDFDKSSLQSGTVKGSTYGVNMGINSTALYVNKSMFTDMGLTMPDNTMTWSDFADLLGRIKKKSAKGVYPTPNFGRVDVAFEAWLKQRGLPGRYTEDGKLAYSPQNLTEWLTMWDDLYAKGLVMRAEIEDAMSGDVSDSGIATRKTPFALMWSNQYAAIDAATEDTVDFHMLPKGDGAGAEPGQFYKASMLLSVSSETKSADEAVAFTSALLTDPKIARELGFERGVPPDPAVRKALKDEAGKADLRSLEYVESLEDKLAPVPNPDPAEASEIDAAYLYATDQLFYRKFSVKQAVDHFFSETEKILG